MPKSVPGRRCQFNCHYEFHGLIRATIRSWFWSPVIFPQHRLDKSSTASCLWLLKRHRRPGSVTTEEEFPATSQRRATRAAHLAGPGSGKRLSTWNGWRCRLLLTVVSSTVNMAGCVRLQLNLVAVLLPPLSVSQPTNHTYATALKPFASLQSSSCNNFTRTPRTLLTAVLFQLALSLTCPPTCLRDAHLDQTLHSGSEHPTTDREPPSPLGHTVTTQVCRLGQ